MSSDEQEVIEISSDEDEHRPPSLPAAVPTASTSSRTEDADPLPKSRLLVGKQFMIRGSWVTMSESVAEKLCTANGG